MGEGDTPRRRQPQRSGSCGHVRERVGGPAPSPTRTCGENKGGVEHASVNFVGRIVSVRGVSLVL